MEGSMNGTTDKLLSKPVVAIAMVLFAFIVIVSFLSNCLVIIAFKKCAKLQTVTNYFIVSLAVSDLLISTVSVPLWMLSIARGFPHRPPNTAYKVWIFSDIVGGTASIFNLAVISYERYLCISRPLSTHLKESMAKFWLSAVWFFAIALATMHRSLANYLTRPVNEIFFSLSCFLLPLLFMAFNYLQIFQLARNQLHKIKSSVPKNMAPILLKEVKAAKTIAIIIGVFTLCWTPFFLLNLLYGLCDCWVNISKHLIVTVKWLHYFNSVLNPVIYTWRNREFRELFLKLLHSAFTRRRSQNDGVEFHTLKRTAATVSTNTCS